jgi:hypothetical protein
VDCKKAESRKLKADLFRAPWPWHLLVIILLVKSVVGHVQSWGQSYQWKSSGSEKATGSAEAEPWDDGTKWKSAAGHLSIMTNDFPKLPEVAAPASKADDEIAGIVTLAWDDNPATNIIGVRVYQGLDSFVYDTSVRLVKTTNATMVARPGTNYFVESWIYLVGTGTNAYERETVFGNQVAFVPPRPATNVLVTVYVSTNLLIGSSGWQKDDRFGTVTITNPPGNLYFKPTIERTNF